MSGPSSSAEPMVTMAAELGEGPVWDHRRGRLLWVDILGGLVHSTDPADGVTDTMDVGVHVGAVALYSRSSYLLAVRNGFAALEGGEAGPVEVVFEDPSIRMNDGSVDPVGRFLAGTMAYDESPGRGCLYSRDADGSVRTLVDGVTISNGLAWSDDGSTMYYVDSGTSGVDLFDYDVDEGTLANRRRHLTFEDGDGVPDGIALDAEGCLWVAMYGGSEVRRHEPEGRMVDRIAVPATQVTSCAFGGRELETMFITTSAHGLDPADHRHRLAGALFAVDPGCAGRRENVVPGIEDRLI